MKRVFLLALLVLAGHSALAQDLITKKDGTDIQAKILEVTSTEIKYKKFSNLDGPVFILPKSDILIIRYENGDNEVFNESQKSVAYNTANEVFPGMRYQDYKYYYNTREYVKQPGDQYSPFWIGFGDFFIPGLGNAIAGEWGRAACFFFTNVGLGALSLTQVYEVTTTRGTYYEFTSWYWAIMVARLGLNMWSLCDAVHVAKTKNMYYQDLRAQRASVEYSLDPFFAYTPYTSTGPKPVAGLSLKVNF